MFAVGDRIGNYELIDAIRRGGMGTVFLARAPDGGSVAIKVAIHNDPLTLARFEREIRAMQHLDHPGIVPLLNHGVERGLPWFVMPFISRVNLADIIAGRGADDDPEQPLSLIARCSQGELPPAPMKKETDCLGHW